DSLERDARAMPDLARGLERTTHHEPYRRKVRFMLERLRVTRAAILAVRQAGGAGEPRLAPHAYTEPSGFTSDLELILASVRDNQGEPAGAARVRALIRQVETFRFHLARLDVRIPAEWVRTDARVALGIESGAPLTCEALEQALAGDPAALVVPDGPGMRA